MASFAVGLAVLLGTHVEGGGGTTTAGGLGSSGTKGVSLLCSWLRSSPDILETPGPFASGFSFDVRLLPVKLGPLLAAGEKSFSEPTSDALSSMSLSLSQEYPRPENE